MRKLISYAAIWVLTSLFIFSSSGVYLTIHHCTAENINQLYFVTPPSEVPCEHRDNCSGNNNFCDHTDHGSAHSNAGSSCNLPLKTDTGFMYAENMPECCYNTIILITLEDTYLKSAPPDTCTTHLLYHEYLPDREIYSDKNPRLSNSGILEKPPPVLSFGKEIAYSNRALLL